MSVDHRISRTLGAVLIVAAAACAPKPKNVPNAKATLPPATSSGPESTVPSLRQRTSTASVEVRTTDPLKSRSTLTDRALCYDDGMDNLLIQGRSTSGTLLIMQITHPAMGTFTTPGTAGTTQLTKFTVTVSDRTFADPGLATLVLTTGDGHRGTLTALKFASEPALQSIVTWRCA